MKNVFATLMIAGLIAGSVAKADEHAAAPAAHEEHTTVKTETKEEHSGKGKDAKSSKKMKKTTKTEVKSENHEEAKKEEAHH